MEDHLYREVENMVARMLATAMEPVMAELNEMKTGQAVLLARSQSWNKKNIWELAKWLLGLVAALGTVIAGMWIGHLNGWIH